MALLALAGACSTSREVTVLVRLPNLDGIEAPVPGLPVVVLSYDRDSVLDALEARAATPRPHAAELDSLFRAFQTPYLALRQASRRFEQYRDTLQALRSALDTIARGDPAYQPRFQLFAQLSDSLHRAEQARDRARTELEEARKTFVPLSDSLRLEVRRWEATTFAGYDTIVAHLSDRLGREAVADTTDADGVATITLGPGRRWIYARAWDVEDPNFEWYWNVPLTADTLTLDSHSGARVPIY